MTHPDPSTSRFHTAVTRRVIGAFAALALAGTLAAGPAIAAAATSRGVGTVRTAPGPVQELLDALDEDEIAALRDGLPNVPGTGLRVGDLAAAQQAAVYALLRSLLSAAAWEEFSALRDADTALGVADDHRVALFGDPDGDHVVQFSTDEVLLSILSQDGVVEVRPDVVL